MESENEERKPENVKYPKQLWSLVSSILLNWQKNCQLVSCSISMLLANYLAITSKLSLLASEIKYLSMNTLNSKLYNIMLSLIEKFQ